MDDERPMLQVQNLTVNFGFLSAVSNVSFEVCKGDILGIIGPNGSGKTTLINTISGVYKPTKGQIFFFQKGIDGLPPHRISRIGINRTFQNLRLFRNLTVLDNVLIGQHSILQDNLVSAMLQLPYTRKNEKKAKASAVELLERLGLRQYESTVVSSLPYGIQRKVEIARALANHPELVLLDEPTAGMNAEETEQVMEFIRQLQNEGQTLLIIEHNMKVMMEIPDRIIVLNAGEKLADGTPIEIFNDERVREAYLGKGE